MRKTSKLQWAALVLLVVTIVLQALPYGVAMYAEFSSGGERARIVNTYAYFSLYPLVHLNCAPFISAATCVTATMMLLYSRLRKKPSPKSLVRIIIGVSVSMAASAIHFIAYYPTPTLLSGIITGILIAVFILCLLIRKIETGQK